MNTYFNETLQELSLQVLKKEKALRECNVLEARYNELKVQAEELAASKEREEAEARKASDNFFLSHFAKGKVDKEALEAYVAEEKYLTSRKELELLNVQLNNARKRLQQFGDCDVKYQQLYEKTRQELLAKADEKAEAILETEAQIATLCGQLVEVDEAFALANEAIEQTNLIAQEIDVLKATGFWHIASVKKLENMAAELNVLLTKLKGEMKDISLHGEFGLFFVEGGSAFGDFFLDGAATDYVLQKRIYDMVPRLTNVRNDIYKAHSAIEKVKKEYLKELEMKQKKLKELIVEAE